MHQATRSKLTLADLMFLIGANSVSLACCILIDNNLYGGGRYFFGVFDWSAKNWNSPFLPFNELKNGGTIQFVMGPKPSQWGTSPTLP